MPAFVPCPKCRSTQVKQMGFTWWGGALGPKLLSHCKCQQCGAQFNGKTGASNTTGIVIYSIVGFFIALIVFGVLYGFVLKP